MFINNIISAIKKRTNKKLINLFFLILISFILRFHIIKISTFNIDESVYLLGSRGILNGEIPFISENFVWDHKPIGIYYIYAFIQLIFGQSITAIRIGSIITISLTAWFLYMIGITYFKKRIIGIVAAILYLFLSPANEGLSANTEIFSSLLIVAAFYVFFRYLDINQEQKDLKGKVYFLIIGILIGLSFNIKFIGIFEAGSIMIILLLYYYQNKALFKKEILFNIIIMVSVIIFIFLCQFLFYYIRGNFDYVFKSIILSNFYHVLKQPSHQERTIYFMDELKERWLIYICLIISIIRSFNDSVKNIKKTHILIWFLSSFLTLIILGALYKHYMLQLLPPLCIISAIVIDEGFDRFFQRYKMLYIFILSFIIIIGCYNTLNSFIFSGRYRSHYNDTPKKISQFINKDPGSVFVINYEPIIYYLTKSPLPTKYAFSPFILKEHYQDMLKIFGETQENELRKALNTKPDYIVLSAWGYWMPFPEKMEGIVYSYINRHNYSLIKEFDIIDGTLSKHVIDPSHAVITEIILFKKNN